MPRNYLNQPYVPAKDPLTAIPPSRHPFQFWTMCACIIGGAGNLVDSSSVITKLLPEYIVVLWALLLMISGALALAGAWLPDRVFGLLVERVGLTTLAGSSLIYGSTIFYLLGDKAAVAGPLTISVGIAALWRAVHVTRELRVLAEFIDTNYRT